MRQRGIRPPQFGKRCRTEAQVRFNAAPRFKGEGVLAGGGLCRVGERGDDGSAFVPVAELVGVVPAAELAALPARNEHEGLIPVARAGDETHGRTVTARGRTGAECRSTLWLACDAEECFEPTVPAERVEHFERIEA